MGGDARAVEVLSAADPAGAASRASRRLFADSEAAALCGVVIPPQQSRAPEDLSLLQRISWHELSGYMRSVLLRDSDVLSMAHGLELRVSFLDAEVVLAAFSIAASVKLRGGRSKPVLADAIRGLVPSEGWNRPKQGFTFPFARWLRADLREEVKGALTRERLARVGVDHRAANRPYGAIRGVHAPSLEPGVGAVRAGEVGRAPRPDIHRPRIPEQPIRQALKARLLSFAEKLLGVHIVPEHFGSPVPSIREVDPEISTRINPCLGVDLDAERYLAALRELFPLYMSEYEPEVNTGLSKVDALVLYAMVRSRKPRVLVEIGAGESTRITLAAVERNAAEGFSCAVTSIDPYPPRYLERIATPGFRLLTARVQDVPEHELDNADILFIDSSHVSKFGSDVNYEILSIVPRLKVGALVHWHDIMIPVDYPMSWIRRRMYWNESYMVHAFLLFNDAFRVVWAGKYMQVTQPNAMRRAFPYFDPSDPDQQLTSLWAERVR